MTAAPLRRRLVYLGTPAMAVPPLEALVDAGHEVSLVITRADTRRGRGAGTTPSPVKAAAQRLGLRVSDDLDDVRGCGADMGVVVAYGRLIPAALLTPPDGVPMVNLHFSLLPRWRGAAPVERALLAGDTHTGVCLMQVAEGLDTGDVHARTVVPIAPSDTARMLRERLVQVGTRLLVEALSAPLAPPQPQHGEITYAAKITSDDLRIDWAAGAAAIDRLVRVGGAWTTFRGRRVRVVEAVAATAADKVPTIVPERRVRPTVVQPEGRRPMSFDDFVRGVRPEPGERFA